MKKSLLFASVAAFSFSAFAQKDYSVKQENNKQETRIDQEATSVVVKEPTIPTQKAGSVMTLGTSYNIFSILGDRQNQVVYNSATNTVAFSHRQNNTLAGGSGIISWDYSTDGGATWNINPFATTPTGSGATWNGNRYPNMGIYNPAGNTDPANAYLVQVGPALEDGAVSGSNGWAKNYQTSAKFDGTNLSETYDLTSMSSQGNLNTWGAGGLYIGTNGVAWYAYTNTNNSATTPNPLFNVADNHSKFFIARGDFNTTNNNFDWTAVDTINEVWNTTLTGTTLSDTSNMAGLMNMAWSPDGTVGYMVTMASWGPNTMYRPYVMKTTDAGATWNHVNDYDFSQSTDLQCALQNSDGGTGTIRPFFGSYDMVVDVNNELRIFTKISSGSTSHLDSLNFTFNALQTQFLYEVATNGTGWDITMIDSIRVEDYEYDATNNLSHFVRPQASRSQDGSKVFYIWSSTDPIFGSVNRDFPDVFAVGHDISANTWTQIDILTSGVAGAQYVAAYQTMAVDAIETGSEKDYELPIVYATDLSGNGVSDGLSAPQWNYLKGVGFDASQFTVSGLAPCTVIPTGINENSNTRAILHVYPNPTKDFITIATEGQGFSYTVLDVIGNVVTSNNVTGSKTTINMSNNAKGIYFIRINNNGAVASKKVVLTK